MNTNSVTVGKEFPTLNELQAEAKLKEIEDYINNPFHYFKKIVKENLNKKLYDELITILDFSFKNIMDFDIMDAQWEEIVKYEWEDKEKLQELCSQTIDTFMVGINYKKDIDEQFENFLQNFLSDYESEIMGIWLEKWETYNKVLQEEEEESKQESVDTLIYIIVEQSILKIEYSKVIFSTNQPNSIIIPISDNEFRVSHKDYIFYSLSEAVDYYLNNY
jgi:hypothetical protein